MELNRQSARPDGKMEKAAKKEANRKCKEGSRCWEGAAWPLPNPALRERSDCGGNVGSKETAAQKRMDTGEKEEQDMEACIGSVTSTHSEVVT